MAQEFNKVQGRVVATLLNLRSERKGSTPSLEFAHIEVLIGHGVHDDRHSGPARKRDGREDELKGLFGREIKPQLANMRHFSMVSAEELELVLPRMGVPAELNYQPGLLGENLLVAGLPNLTALPPTTVLSFSHDFTLREATLAVWKPNEPCPWPEANLKRWVRESGYPDWEPAVGFEEAAEGCRGVVGVVYTSGEIRKGDVITAWLK